MVIIDIAVGVLQMISAGFLTYSLQKMRHALKEGHTKLDLKVGVLLLYLVACLTYLFAVICDLFFSALFWL